MAINEAEIMQAVYDLLFSPVTTKAPGVPSQIGLEKCFLTLQKPGLPIDPTDYQNLWSPGNKNSDDLATKRFSDLVNQAPALAEIHQLNGHLISNIYQQILHAQVVPQNPTAEERHAYKEAENFLFKEVIVTDEVTHKKVTRKVDSIAYRNYKQAKANYVKASADYQAQYLEYMKTPEGRQRWPLVGISYRTFVDIAWNNFQAAEATRVEDALLTLEQAAGSQLARVFKDANQQFIGYQRPDPTSDGNLFAASYAIPSNWCDFSQDWVKVSFYAETSQTQIQSDRTQVEFNLKDDAVDLWSIQQNESEQRYTIDATTQNLSIQFEYILVKIERPWLRYDLFSLPDWSVKNLTAGAYSNGTKTEQENSLLPLIPQSFIAIRNLQITANWGEQDMQRIKLVTSNAATTEFGPFLLSCQNTNAQSGGFKSTFAGETITTLGIQIMGWINTITPFSPPGCGL
ncbi:hypothetical protein [Calothrix sp. PCC 7507]|uniref:hypothetical protein n=1 Tax=Calothrix sp. PCC 7507 TaxID=99598 RepID=UPI00029EE50D|nr:hypothetical protein [Calothrix sp. PCC 7507]AFY36078.1 hypothetical protein Cal7507_5758 [Calothrix sp. PCC 7507]